MKEVIITEFAPRAVGPYSQAIKVDKLLFISGQIPIDPQTNNIVEGGIVEQTHQVLRNIGAILKAVNYDYSDVVKCTCLLSDMQYFAKMNEVYSQYFTEPYPARATFAVKTLPLNALVEIECIAYKT